MKSWYDRLPEIQDEKNFPICDIGNYKDFFLLISRIWLTQNIRVQFGVIVNGELNMNKVFVVSFWVIIQILYRFLIQG